MLSPVSYRHPADLLTPTTDVVCWIHPVFFGQTSLLVSTGLELSKQTALKICTQFIHFFHS